jgi:hypothetical protein
VELAAARQAPGRFAGAGAGAVGVPDDHVAAVDAQPARHLGGAVDAAAEDRLAGDVGFEVGAQEAVDPGHGERERGAGGARLEAAGAGAVGTVAGDQLPGRFGRTELAAARAAAHPLGGAEGEAVDGAEEALVVGGPGGVGERPGDPPHRGGGDAFGAGEAEVEVHVVAVGGVDVVAQPDARVGEAQAGGAEGGGDRRGRAGARLGARVERQRHVLDRELVEQRLGEAVVVVAGDEDDVDLADRGAELGEEGEGVLERGAERALAQLDHVAEQDEALGAAQLLDQEGADLRVAQEVAAARRAEVEVGDDRRLHV